MVLALLLVMARRVIPFFIEKGTGGVKVRNWKWVDNTSLVLLILLMSALAISPSLNLLARGELQAASLGIAVGRLRVTIYVLASLATASAVTQAGNIGFVGLIAPHMLRLLGARDHRLLIPGVALLGGTLLLLADSVSRLVIEPRELPVGVLTALLGVPLFLLLLFRTRRLNNE